MNEDIMHDIMEILEIDLNSKEMIVLRALLKTQNEPKTHVDFDTLRSQLEIEEGRRKGEDALIYRTLSRLEQIGFVQVDRSSHKHGYNSNVTLMRDVFQRVINERMKIFERNLTELDGEIQILSSIDPQKLERDLTDFLVGEKELPKPIFAEGWQNILELINEKVYAKLKRGDTIRITVEWLEKFNELGVQRINQIESLLKRGVRFLGLDHTNSSSSLDARLKLLRMWRKRGYDTQYRRCLRNDATYQIIARNREGAVLIVSESPLSATWIPRESNPDLVDNAINSFDIDFKQGIELI